MAATNNMHNLTTLIKRLEAATSRLEDIATSVDATSPTNLASVSQRSVPASISTAQSVTPVATPAPAATPASPPEPLPRSIEEFDKLIENEVADFVTASSKLGGLVEEQAQSVRKAFEAERVFLLVSTKAKKPEQPPPELMTDIHRYTSSIDDLREANRPSPYFQHLSAVAEGIVALGWIMDSRPVNLITETLGGAQYYGNKILKEYKDKDKSHVDYIQAYYKVFRSLGEYVKEHFKTGLTWKSDGIDVLEALEQVRGGQTATKSAPAAGGPPPPPPPPLPTFEQLNGTAPPAAARSGAGDAKGGDMMAIFSQLNQGSSVTSGLRKVDKSEMTHKNPSLRAAGTVPQRSSSQTSTGSTSRGKSPMPARKPDSLRTKKPSRKELDGTKWIVENFDNTGNEIVEIPAELNHSILISRCSKCIIKVNGKANAISIDNCTGLSILVGSLVSSLDVIKSPKFAVQIDGALPTILLDQVDGGQIYLGEKSMTSPPEILTSKCSAINVVLPPKGDEDSKEQPLPEQLRTYFKDGKLYSEIVEHAG